MKIYSQKKEKATAWKKRVDGPNDDNTLDKFLLDSVTSLG